MTKQKIVILLGSASDVPFAHSVEDFLKEAKFPIKCEYRVDSAHRNPEKLLADLKSYEKSNENIVYITVAGLSDALSGVVAGFTKYPVIACPPDIDKHGLPKIFSSIMTPRGIAVSYVPKPENAALAAAKILALSNSSLARKIEQYLREAKRAVEKMDAEIKAKEAFEMKREHVEAE
ncbi:MAG: AIR carboxylase family protein [Candidatus Bathyarchaeota archaeon]|nr:AIR carboxylase family protein [Candidatus Bathyarchaeota archaeon]